ncbi:MAG: methyltransferase [Sinobacteraceae bacterium]|nr:methyltransferase [Nevskiaceae bacterium]
MNKKLLSVLLGATMFAPSGAALATDHGALARAIDSPARTPAFRARDRFRHPLQTLEFFGIRPNMTVVEIWPSAGWYTEILAPYLRDRGHYYAAGFAVSLPGVPDFYRRTASVFAAKLAADPSCYDRVTVTEFQPPQRTAICPPGSADLVLTFRNVHNWISGGYEQAAFDAFYRALKPGGVLGVVEHRARPYTTLEQTKASGYVNEAYVKALAANAGFRFVAASPVNDNPRDTKDYPKGVWTLPPTLRLGEVDRAKYLAIGESDRMTLKFVKPKDASALGGQSSGS